MPHRGSETGETGWLWADALADWGTGLAVRLNCLQAAVRDLEGAEHSDDFGKLTAECLEEARAHETYGIPPVNEAAGDHGEPDQ